MKIISKEEEKAHYSEVLRGGLIGGVVGLGVAVTGVVAASRRYPAFRNLSLPFQAFLVTSSGTFGAIVNAERHSVAFQKLRDPMRSYTDVAARSLAEARAKEPLRQQLMNWGRDHRYTIVFWSWVASMGGSLAVVGRSKYLTTAQKVVQARVAAQGLTLAVVLLTAVFEMTDAKKGSGRWETVLVLDPEDPEHKHLIEKRIHKEEYAGQDLWKDMVAAEEKRMAGRNKQNSTTEETR